MEQEDVQAPDSISFIESAHALLVYPLEGLKIRAIHWRTEGKSHAYSKS